VQATKLRDIQLLWGVALGNSIYYGPFKGAARSAPGYFGRDLIFACSEVIGREHSHIEVK
jgi:hypothetical protein